MSLNTVEGGASVPFTVRLRTKPASSVYLNVCTGDSGEGWIDYPYNWCASLVFDPTNWDTTQTVNVIPIHDGVADGNVTYKVTVSVDQYYTTDTNYMNVPPVDVSVTNADIDVPGFTVSKATAQTSEATPLTPDTFTVVLNMKPSATVTIPVTAQDTTEGLLRGGSSPGTSQPSITLTFTTSNWSTPQTVSIYGQDDQVADGNQTYNVTVGPPQGASEYASLPAKTIQVTNIDNDIAGITITKSGTPLVTSESGTTATFTAKLNTQPTSNVTVPVKSENTAEGLLSAGSQNLVQTVNLAFDPTNWNSAQTVTVTGQDDTPPVYGDNVTYNVTIGPATGATEYAALAAQTVKVLNVDNDTPAIIVPEAGGSPLQTYESGANTTATFTVFLNKAPASTVTIPVTVSDATEGLVRAPGGSIAYETINLTFTSTDWWTAQTVTVVGQPDSIADGNQTYTISVGPASSSDSSFNGLSGPSVSVTNIDTNVAGFTVSTTSLTTTENGAAVPFTVVLNAQPLADVVIPVSSSKPAEGLVSGGDSGGSFVQSLNLTFTQANWQTAQTVQVKGPWDHVDDGNQSYTITVGPTQSTSTQYNGVAAKTINATNIDIDTAGFTVTPQSGLVTTEAGGTATFTVVLNTIPTGNVNIPLSIDDTSEALISTGGGSPTNYLSLSFNGSTWNTPQTVTVTGQNDTLIDGNRPWVVSVGPTTSGDTKYNNLAAKTVTGSNTDNDIAANEGSSGSPLNVTGQLPRSSQVGPSSYSYYYVTGLSGVVYVKLSDPSASVTVTVDDDGNYSNGTLCNFSVAAFANGGCVVTVPASGSIYIRVQTSSSTGAGYTLDVTAVPPAWQHVATGWYHSCAVVNGSVKCWGYNANGQLGNGSSTTSTVPVQVSGLTSGVTAVAAGYYHSCAIVNGGVWCWGDNFYGQLGSGSYTSSSTPIQVSGLTSGATAIAAGAYHSCAVVNGAVKCWGYNGGGQLGNASYTDSNTPVQVSGLTSGVTDIGAGWYHSCAVANMAAKCWGANSYGQLGNASNTDSNVPVQVSGLSSGVTYVGPGYFHSCAIVNEAVKCWGENWDGQLGNASYTDSNTPVQVYGLSSGATAVGAGYHHSCAVVNGGLKCWGYNTNGQLGNGSTTTSTVPAQVSGLSSGGLAVAGGYSHTCAAVDAGVKCWGYNYNGQLGNGSTTTSTVPVTVTFP